MLKIPIPRDSRLDQSKEFWLSQSRRIGRKLLGLLRLGQKSTVLFGLFREIVSFETQVLGSIMFWASSPVPCPSLTFGHLFTSHLQTAELGLHLNSLFE